MRRFLLWALLGLSLSANAAAAAVVLGGRLRAQAAPREAPVLARIPLDPDQRARVMVLRGKLLADREEQAARLAALRGTLADLLMQEPADRPAIDGTLAAIEARQAGFQGRVVAHVLAVREVLRPEQRPAFHALVAEHVRTGAPLDPSSAAGMPAGARP